MSNGRRSLGTDSQCPCRGPEVPAGCSTRGRQTSCPLNDGAQGSRDMASVCFLGGPWLMAHGALRPEAPSEPEPRTKACCRRRNMTTSPCANAQASSEALHGHQMPAHLLREVTNGHQEGQGREGQPCLPGACRGSQPKNRARLGSESRQDTKTQRPSLPGA